MSFAGRVRFPLAYGAVMGATAQYAGGLRFRVGHGDEPPRVVAVLFGLVVIGIALAALFGSLAGWEGATSWVSRRPVAVPLTATGLLGLGIAVVAAARRSDPGVLVGSALALGSATVSLGVRRGWWPMPESLEAHPSLQLMDPHGVSASSSIALIMLAGLGLGFLVLHAIWITQVMIASTALMSYVALIAYMLGDDSLSIEGSSFPGAHTAVPTAAALLLVAAGSVMAEPDRGTWAWLNAPGAGRAIFRRILPLIVTAPLAVVAVVRAGELDRRLGGPRADAMIVMLMVLLGLVSTVLAVREIDRLALEASRRELADRLASAHAAAARQAGAVASLASALSASSSVRSITDTLLSHGPRTLAADLIGISLPESDRRVLWTTRVSGGSSHTVAEDPGEGRTLAAAVYERGEMVWVDDLQLLAGSHPEEVAALRRVGIVSMAALPLAGARGGIIGVLTVGWSSQIGPDDTLRAVVTTVAEVCSQTLQRALLTDSEHRLIATLQDRLVGRPPAVLNLDLDVRYEPAAEAGMGGDWYEVIPRPDGTVIVVLGDVSGHGVEAVADMAQARTLIGALVRQGSELGDVLHRVDALVGREDPVMATVALVRVDPAEGVLEYTSAGHPPVALRQPDGRVSLCESSRQPLIGAGIDLRRIEPEQVSFAPGSVVVAYTDGLIERRSEDLSLGLERLRGALAGAPDGPAAAIGEHLMQVMIAGRQADDDTALVVIRRN
jgi:hypothetical protein